MSLEEMAHAANLPYNENLAYFAKMLVAQCAQVALANDDLFTMRDILDWYESAQ